MDSKVVNCSFLYGTYSSAKIGDRPTSQVAVPNPNPYISNFENNTVKLKDLGLSRVYQKKKFKCCPIFNLKVQVS